MVPSSFVKAVMRLRISSPFATEVTCTCKGRSLNEATMYARDRHGTFSVRSSLCQTIHRRDSSFKCGRLASSTHGLASAINALWINGAVEVAWAVFSIAGQTFAFFSTICTKA